MSERVHDWTLPVLFSLAVRERERELGGGGGGGGGVGGTVFN